MLPDQPPELAAAVAACLAAPEVARILVAANH
jgi:hypothetical protein